MRGVQEEHGGQVRHTGQQEQSLLQSGLREVGKTN